MIQTAGHGIYLVIFCSLSKGIALHNVINERETAEKLVIANDQFICIIVFFLQIR